MAALSETAALRLVAAVEHASSPVVGREAGGVRITTDFPAALTSADVVIDFTRPDASLQHVAACVASRRPLVIGTTGFSPEAREFLAQAARSIPLVLAPNMSVGVNVLFKVASEVAAVLGEQYDVEIVETHHRLKKDAPSGTALRLAEVLAGSLGLDPQRDLIKAREGDIGERPHRKIGVQTLRGGDVVGDHTVFFLGPGERVELTHRATSRGNFAQGALRAAQWIVRQPPGLYDMQDVLGLRARAGGTQ
jgi:4-hydroxy-tetrahydrodipicolinate reductase